MTTRRPLPDLLAEYRDAAVRHWRARNAEAEWARRLTELEAEIAARVPPEPEFSIELAEPTISAAALETDRGTA